MIIYSCVWKFFWEGRTLGADHWGGEGWIFFENFYHKILLRGGGEGARDLGSNCVEIFLNWGSNWRARKRKYSIIHVEIFFSCRNCGNFFQYSAQIWRRNFIQ